MSQADGSDVLPLTIRFSPHMVPDMNTQRYATLTITTNDPMVPTLTLQLYGAGTVPSVYATPTFCNFTDPNDPCGGSRRSRTSRRSTLQRRLEHAVDRLGEVQEHRHERPRGVTADSP